ncbi:MAG: type II toxin-antitoxin system VapC family toxin [Salinivenus sp.]
MIVVDNDVISYFWLEARRTEAARRVRERDADWHAPRLWRSEFRNVLYQHMAHRGLSLSDAQRIAETVEADLENTTYSVATPDVLRLVAASGHPAYDCEYVALAQELSCQLVTGDQDLADAFSGTAVLMEDFVAEPT